MNCKEVVERLITQPGGEAPSGELERHLWGCASCSRVFLDQKALWRQMDAWESPEISAGFDRRLFSSIGRRLAEPWASLDWMQRLFRPLQPAFPAALACMLLAAAVVVESSRFTPASPRSQALEKEEIRQIDVALDDLEMLSEFEILPLEPEQGQRS